MTRIITSEQIATSRLGGIKPLRLKGHVKVNLYNKITGKNKTVEGENIMTYALRDLMAENYLGAMKYGALMDLASRWFGGILVYHDAFATTTIDGQTVPDPADYFPQGDDANELIAHAGNEAPATAEIVRQDYKRGSPIDLIQTANTLKQVWEWDTVQGNGIISALALTHKDVGNAGIGNTSSAFKALDPFENLTSSDLPASAYTLTGANNAFTQYDDNHSLWFAIGEEGEYTPENYHTRFETDKLTVYKRRLPYSKAGLFETWQTRENYPETFTVTVPFNLYIQPCYHFDYTNKRLWIFSNITGTNAYDPTAIKYAVIDCRAGIADNARILDSGTLSCDTEDLAPIPFQPRDEGMHYSSNLPINFNIINDGTYIWLPRTSGVDWSDLRWNMGVTGYQKIKISDDSIQTSIDLNTPFTRAQGSSVKAGGLIISTGGTWESGSTAVINGETGYECAANYPTIGTNGNAIRTFTEPYNPVNFVTGAGTHSGMNMARYVLATKFLHTTKYNLREPVEKTGTQAMTIEYTLTEI